MKRDTDRVFSGAKDDAVIFPLLSIQVPPVGLFFCIHRRRGILTQYWAGYVCPWKFVHVEKEPLEHHLAGQ